MRHLAPSLRLLLPLVLVPLTALPAVAATPPCQPCAGLHVADPHAAAAALEQAPPIVDEGRLYVAWDVDLATPAAAAADPGDAARAVEAAGGTPWLRLLFHAPPPVAENLPALEEELRRAAAVAAGAGPATHFQVIWQPALAPDSLLEEADEYAFVLKRAAVAISGAQGEARVITQPLPAAPQALARLYAAEVKAYVDGVSLEAPSPQQLEAAVAQLAELDPGRPVVVEGLPFPAEAGEALAEAAASAQAGAAVALFELPDPAAGQLAPLVLLANQFQGDLSFDPYSVPGGADGAWSFVRGEDLGLRLIVRTPPGADQLVLRFPDPQLRRPERFDPATGEASPLFGLRQLPDGLEVSVRDPAPVEVLRLDRATAAELEGIEEEVDVTDERQMPVEEILRRLQAFEDAQSRRLEHFQATNTTHLRFQTNAGGGTFEATFEGAFFSVPGKEFDWAWQRLYIDGVAWRSKELPQIPLLQPEKAAALPLAIELSKRYDYQLRGTEEVAGRDCWVVEFRPVADAVAEEENLFRGTVWVDRQLFARVRTRAVQLGLEGEVISNEETVTFSPITGDGQPAPWTAQSYYLPLRTVGQQIWSVLNTPVVVEREVLLTNVRVNSSDFASERQAVLDSEATMVRDTEAGLRYLVHDKETGQRVVQEGFDTSSLFLVGGVFYDDALDYPLPLAGVNWFTFDLNDSGNQFNVFFGGALLTADIAQPRLFGSRWDLGADVFAFAVPLSDSLYRDGEEVVAEEVESRPSNVSLLIGRQLGQFVRLGFEYELSYDDFSSTDDTADDFILPSDHFTHTGELSLRFSRSGYQLGLTGSYNRRSEWQPWGRPGNPGYDPKHEDYLLWEATLSKNFYLPSFRRLGLELNYFGGQDLDRFSKYTFGFFGGTRIHGYQSDRVRAEDGFAGHLSYGLELGESFRIRGVADAAVVNDEASGLSDELLGGVGLVGQFLGPWKTVVQVDAGVPVAGPDDGFVLYLVFLKLFQ